MRPVSPPRTGPVSRDATEPLEEGEERSPGRKVRKPRGGRGRKRGDRERDRGNWDSFVAADEDRDEYLSGEESRRMFEPRRGRSRSRSLQARTRTPSHKSKSRSRSPAGNAPAVPTRSTSREKRSHLSPRSPSRSASRSPRSRSPTQSQDNAPRSHGRSPSRSRSLTPSLRQSRSRSCSPYRSSRREREPWAERNASPAPNPGAAPATASAPDPGPAIPTGPRWRASGNPPPGLPVAPRNAPVAVRGGPPPTGPRGDREPPRGPRNMMIPGPNAPASANTAPAVWERPQSTFQSYLAAVQSKLVEREGKKKGEEEVGPNNGAEASSTQVDSNAMDVDVKEEPVTSAGGSHLNTPAPELSEGSRIASPAHSNLAQALHSVQASPALGLGIPLPAPPGPPYPNAQPIHVPAPQPYPLPQVHPLPLPPRPRSPPRGPRATRGLPEKPKAMGMGGQEFSRERDRDRDSAERGARDRNASTSGVQPPEGERKVHALPTNPARRPRVPVVRATKREALFPDLEKEIASLEEQRARLANEHLPHAIAFRQAIHDLTLSTIDYRAAEDRRVMTESVLEAMVKGTGLAAAGDV
ncbi:hypothetical protein FS749_003108 [Ceratobasidium sp. UAMH 11750]|nr:hypothetical protein FS749_003108 [Ceratobasidium sp. UAMH 11750]